MVVVVDDGAATGLTIRCALRYLKKKLPKKLIVALPVAPHAVVALLRNEVDEVFVYYDVTGIFQSVGEFYDDFSQVTDEAVVALLKKFRENKHHYHETNTTGAEGSA